MKFTSIISRYIFKELISPFAVSLLFLSFIFLMTKIPEFTNLIVNHNAGITSLFLLLLYSFPRFLEFILPMSVMISVLLTFMRMAGDNEIIALKGGGVSLYRLLPPVLTFCTLVTCIALWVSIIGVPKSKIAVENKSIEIAQSSFGIALQQRVFNTDIEGIMIYVSSVDPVTKKLNDIFIEDSRTKGMVNISTAPNGVLVLNEELKIYTLRLYNGKINQVDLIKNSVNTIFFTTYDINMDYKHMFKTQDSKRRKELEEMGLEELYAFIKENKNENTEDLNKALMDFYGKFSLPFACVCLGILAFPLGIQSVSLKRSSGFGLGLFFFMIYYILLAIGWSAGESGKYPPVIGMWMPNIIMGTAGLYLLYRNAKEQPVKMPLFFSRLISKVIFVIKFYIFRKRAE
ncbi:MAG: LPS export ABC transporter permease LptF [Desulfobacteraceae bacterium]|nr:LPS export ABC transporter permease LptF [Desulfobacteraceae bacterium]